MNDAARARLQMHICVVLWGFTAILGKLITLSPRALVFWRTVIVSLTLALVPSVWRGARRLSLRLWIAYAGIGVVVALHWVTFYAAIRLSNASVAASCVALAPSFVALVGPRWSGQDFDVRELLLGALVVPGVALVVGGTPVGMHIGVALAVISALLDGLLGLLNKRYAQHAEPAVVTGVEMVSALLVLAIAQAIVPAPDTFALPSLRDAWLLFALAIGCTLLPFTLSLVALRKLSAFGAQLIVNLEPVYAIVLGVLFLGEQHELGLRFYGGVALILGAVFVQPLLSRVGIALPERADAT